MGATYEFVLRKPTGQFITSVCDNDYTNADYTLQSNSVGRMYLTLPARRYPVAAFGEDTLIEIWRTPRGGKTYLEGETSWIVTNLQGTSTATELHAETANSLLKRRVNSYQNVIDEGQVLFPNSPLDDMLKIIARQNFGPAARTYAVGPNPDPRRDLSAYLTIQANAGLWPSARRRTTNSIVFDVATVNADKASGLTSAPIIYYFFDVVTTNFTGTPPFFQLRTYQGQRGTDRRNIITFAEDENTMTNARLFYDWGNSASRILAGGPGTDAARIFTVSDDPNLATLLLTDPFALREKFVNAKKTTNVAETQSYGNDYLANKDTQPYTQLSATLTESSCLKYGVDFFFGDRVSAYFLGQKFDTFVNPVHVHLEDSKEKIDVQITEKTNAYASELGLVMKRLALLQNRLNELETIDLWG